MFVILITIIALANCLEQKEDNNIDDEIKKIVGKYVQNIPDVEPQYVIHEGLSKLISEYFKQKITTFPLYKISLKLDRNPVKIPWSLVDANNTTAFSEAQAKADKEKQRIYTYVPDPKKE